MNDIDADDEETFTRALHIHWKHPSKPRQSRGKKRTE